MKNSAFSAFPKEGLQFLRSLQRNNNREWFQEHKGIYDEYVQTPMTNLYLHISPSEVFIGGGLYLPEPENLNLVRQAIADKPDGFSTSSGIALSEASRASGSVVAPVVGL
jgi:uncharacterized protein (DUF2461 family)